MTNNISTDAIVERLHKLHPKVIDLSLERIYKLLDKVGNPQINLPPVVHVAGTNGKGSTVAFMRAFFEQAGLKVHTFTSPHLTRFAERIRISGKLLKDDKIVALLEEAEQANGNEPITFFEVTTVAAFMAFARNPADVLLLETGLGGRLDATNVVEKPALTILTPISMDHESYLGDTIEKIAFEKAGIMKSGAPCITANQEKAVLNVLEECATNKKVSLCSGGKDWSIYSENNSVYFKGINKFKLPMPALAGEHQVENAGLAIAGIEKLVESGVFDKSIFKTLDKGMKSVTWAGRLQKLSKGVLFDMLPKDCELWIDGGHNPSAGEMLGKFISNWNDKPLHIITGMMTTKDTVSFLKNLTKGTKTLQAVPIHGFNSFSAKGLQEQAIKAGFKNAKPANSTKQALENIITNTKEPVRILVCGSLYLLGTVLKENG
ncbi:MAG: bifunctional folylpolyglutamate synthase/dihydrofolate synthase [Alphaproteobacteria bacterium]|nr:bifunctional folylpolyglutamate synthase/dihydrofolate synthase [Alphaproteobacteria bacterium]